MGGFSNFAISFSIISILTGAVTLFGYGLEMGGPLEMTLGWPLATVFTLAVAASMAELCSAYPTSGAMYHWAAALGGRNWGPTWGWFVAWLNIAGLTAALAGISYSCAQFILPFLGVPSTYLRLLAMFGFILLTQALLNHVGIRLVAILNDCSVTVHVVGVLALVAAVFLFASNQPVSFLSQAVNSNGRSPYWWAFVLGLLQAQWTYTGFDGSAHVAEETEDPRRHAPWGIVLSVAVSGVVGYLLVLTLTLGIRTIPAALGARDTQGNSIPAAIAILEQALGTRAGNAMAALASMAMWFCGLSCVTSASRAIFALARDHGTPYSHVLRRVSARHGTPAAAIWLFVSAAFAAMLWTGAVPVVTSLSTVALYAAYIVPVVLGFRARNAKTAGPAAGWQSAAVWSLGSWGAPINVVAIAYTVFICFVLVMPPNELAGKTFLGLMAGLTLLYFLVARRKYKGPEWSMGQNPVPSPGVVS